MVRGSLAFTALILFACTDNVPARPRAIPAEVDAAPQRAEASVCFGARTSCEVPDFMPLTRGADTQIACEDGEPLALAWTADLGIFDAELPNCPAVDATVAEGADSYWSVAELREPSPEGPLGDLGVGFVLEQFDEAGKLLRAIPSDVRRKVDGFLDEGTTRVVASNAEGELSWATASEDGATLELRRYSARGKLEAAMTPVMGATSTYGDARFLADGAALVAYRYLEIRRDGSASQRLVPGVARLDGAGRVQWNQTFFSNMLEADASIGALSIAIAGLDDAGNAVLQMSVAHADGTVDANVLELDEDGNVTWARRIEGAAFINENAVHSSVGVTKDGSVWAAYSLESPYSTALERIGPDGASRGRLLTDHAASPAMVAFDADGRAIDTYVRGAGSVVEVLDVGASSCTVHALSPAGCVLDADGAQHGCDDPYIALTGSGDVFFGVANTVGLARWH
jgi:hypothetical protein